MIEDRKIRNLKATIRKLLKDAGVYRKELSYQVELLASDILAYRLIANYMRNSEFTVMVDEVTRDGVRSKINPCYDALAKTSDRVRRDLEALGMVKKLRVEDRVSAEAEEDDPLVKLLSDDEGE